MIAGSTQPIALMTATEIATRVQRGTLSPVDVAAAFLRRIDDVEPQIGAFCAIRRDEVMKEAAALGSRGDLAKLPLAGVPIGIKDLFSVAGIPRRAGSRATSDAPSTHDHELVARVRRAGALVIGLTTLPELGLWAHGEADVYRKTTVNPWKLSATSGGSSAGSAAAVAAGMVPIALGSDGLGSIRIPAACCGVVGFKAGTGVVPRGDMPAWFGHAEAGPLATTVEDTALLLGVLSGRRWPERSEGRLARIAVGLRAPAPGMPVHGELRAAAERAARALADAGHSIDVIEVPRSIPIVLSLFRRWCAFVADDVAKLGLPEHQLEPLTRTHLRAGKLVLRRQPPDDAEVARQRAVFARIFADHDLLLQPTLAQPPPATREFRTGWLRSLLRMSSFTPFTPGWNLAQYPSMSLPAGLAADGLPIGVMLGGATGSEELMLSVAYQLEAVNPWPRHAPL